MIGYEYPVPSVVLSCFGGEAVHNPLSSWGKKTNPGLRPYDPFSQK